MPRPNPLTNPPKQMHPGDQVMYLCGGPVATTCFLLGGDGIPADTVAVPKQGSGEGRVPLLLREKEAPMLLTQRLWEGPSATTTPWDGDPLPAGRGGDRVMEGPVS